jgi:hypothetical protein
MSGHSQKTPDLRVEIMASRFQEKPIKVLVISKKRFADHLNRGGDPQTIATFPIVIGPNSKLATPPTA